MLSLGRKANGIEKNDDHRSSGHRPYACTSWEVKVGPVQLALFSSFGSSWHLLPSAHLLQRLIHHEHPLHALMAMKESATVKLKVTRTKRFNGKGDGFLGFQILV